MKYVLVDKLMHLHSNVDHLVNYVILFWVMKNKMHIHRDHLEVKNLCGMLNILQLLIYQQMLSKNSLLIIFDNMDFCRYEFPVRQWIDINNQGDVFDCANR